MQDGMRFAAVAGACAGAAAPVWSDGYDRARKHSRAEISRLIRSLRLIDDFAALTMSSRNGLAWISGQKNAIIALSSSVTLPSLMRERNTRQTSSMWHQTSRGVYLFQMVLVESRTGLGILRVLVRKAW